MLRFEFIASIFIKVKKICLIFISYQLFRAELIFRHPAVGLTHSFDLLLHRVTIAYHIESINRD